MVKQTPTPTIKFPTIQMQTIQIVRNTEDPDLSTYLVRPVGKQTTPRRKVTLEQIQRTYRLHGIDDRKDKTKSNREMLNAIRMGIPKLQTKLKIRNATSSLGSCRWQTGDKFQEITKRPPIPEVVWHQPMETITDQFNLNKTDYGSIIYYTQEKTTLASKTSPPNGTQPWNYVVTTEHLPRNETRNEPVPFLNCSKNCPTDIQNSKQHVTTKLTRDTTIPPLTTTTPLIEEGLVRDEQTNEVYLPLTSTVVLKPKQKMLHVPLDFVNSLTVDALVGSEAFVGAIAQNDLDTMKEKAPNNILKIDDPPNFQIQVTNGQLEKPLSTATFIFEVGDNSFAGHFVVWAD